MSYITVVSKCRCRPGKSNEYISALNEFLGPSREEEGCISYDVYQDTQDSQNFIFHEIWKDQEAVSIHINSSHFKRFMETSDPLLEKLAGDSPFLVTIASPFDPQSPPQGSEIIVATLCSSQPGKSSEVRNSAPALILHASCAEPGCSAYQLYQGIEKEDLFMLYEVWKGFSAIQEHMGTAHFAQFMEKAPSLFVPEEKKGVFSVNICTPYT